MPTTTLELTAGVSDGEGVGRARVSFALKVRFVGPDIPAPGSTFFAGDAAITSASDYHYPPLIKSIAPFTYSVSDRGGGLPATEVRVEVFDNERTLAKFLSGRYADGVRGASATLYLASPDVAFANWSVLFDGVVARVEYPEPFIVALVLRTNDLLLSKPSKQPLITRQTWPSAAPSAYGLVAPVVYGVHDCRPMSGGGGPGLIPTICVSTIAWRYMVSIGKLKSIDRVYVDGVDVGTSTWSTEYLSKDGYTYTIVKFTASQGEGVVTVDCNGYESVGDGSGAVIDYPSAQLAHFLSNFVLASYRTGNWNSTNSLINSTLLSAATTDHTNIGQKGSAYFAERLTGIDALALYCTSFGRRCFWTKAGTVGISREDPFQDQYAGGGATGYTLVWNLGATEGFSMSERDFEVMSRVAVSDYYSASAGKYLRASSVIDAAISSEESAVLNVRWGASQ